MTDALAENFDASVNLTAAAAEGSNFDGGSPSVPAIAGVAQFNDLALDDAAEGYQLTAAHGDLISALSNTFDVNVLQVDRTLSLNLRKHLRAKGLLNASGPAGCEDGRKVRVQKRRANGTWKTLRNATTNNSARFSVSIPDRPGKYRALAPQIPIDLPTMICAATKSPVRTHNH